VNGSTATVYGHTRRCLVEYLGADRPLQEITAGDADAWRLWLIEHEKLADNTVRRRCGIAKQFFKAAMRRNLIAENPFADLVAAVRHNDKRYYFVTKADAQRVLDACSDAQWRLLFALSRFGGLRCPSEHLGLRWGDVDWERGRITVHSPKTEHHPGGASRQIPIFPELRPYLEEVWEQAEPGTEWVITRYRDSNVNLRSQLLDIIWKTKLREWPKLFQNLRSTRQTELAETYPMHVVCSWIGNSAAVAAKHYLQVTDEHYLQASKEAVQNPVQQAHENPCDGSQENTATPGFSEDFQRLLECT
jgi:integrase